VILDYAGDDPNKNRIFSWFEMQLRAIGTCLDAGLAEAALALIYSGIDTFGLLDAPPAIENAGSNTFKQWCEKYILPRVQPVEGGPVNAIDLWAARCGVLHTSTPLSALERAGKAHQIWYRLNDSAGVNFIMNTALPPLGIDHSKPRHGLQRRRHSLHNRPQSGCDGVSSSGYEVAAFLALGEACRVRAGPQSSKAKFPAPGGGYVPSCR
jgi:hypothetical protein